MTFAKEKPLKVRERLVNGFNHQGSHFLILAFTNNRGHRSVPAKIARGLASQARLDEKIGERLRVCRSRGAGPDEKHWSERTSV